MLPKVLLPVSRTFSVQSPCSPALPWVSDCCGSHAACGNSVVENSSVEVVLLSSLLHSEIKIWHLQHLPAFIDSLFEPFWTHITQNFWLMLIWTYMDQTTNITTSLRYLKFRSATLLVMAQSPFGCSWWKNSRTMPHVYVRMHAKAQDALITKLYLACQDSIGNHPT
jgi:hypothetical protein